MPSPSSIDPSALSSPGYTPGRGELPQVIQLLIEGDEEASELAARALGRAGAPAALLLAERLPSAPAAAGPRLIRVMGRLAQAEASPPVLEALLRCLTVNEPRVRRAAIVVLGKLGRPEHESALLDRFDAESGAERRALIEALGKVGASRSLTRLDALRPSNEVEAELCRKARLLLLRRVGRSTELPTVRFDVPMPSPQRLVLMCRHGLAPVVEEQLVGLPGIVRASTDRLFVHGFEGSLDRFLLARSWSSLGIVLEMPETAGDDPELPRKVATRLLRDDARRLLGRLSSAAPRLRLSVPEAGHQRALLWAITEAMQAGAPDILVDPEGATWEVWLTGKTAHKALFLLPRTFVDPRFAYRKADVPAASHPTVAAALAHVLGVRDDDVIWDPFVGSGLELIERAKLGPYRALFGTDTDPGALRAARLNAEGAGIEKLELILGDARVAGPARATAIISNPPLGSRLVRDGSLGVLFDEVLAHAHRVLTIGGRLVWLSPVPARSRDTALRLGFTVQEHGPVDIGGLRPVLQVMNRGRNPKRRRLPPAGSLG